MPQNLLITGAAGYIGGSILSDFINRATGPIKSANIIAAVRSEEQVEILAKLGTNVVQLDVADERATKEAVLRNEIDIILHTARSHDPQIVSNLIQALGERRKETGNETYFIHTSGTTAFAPEAGWPSVAMKDTDPIFEIERQISASYPIRLTDITVTEEGKAHGVTTFIVVVPAVYGRGTGECNKLSIAFPIFIRASIKNQLVYRFDKNGIPAAIHISDLTAFYGLLTEQILLKEIIPNGEKGYYFAVAHRMSSWVFMQRLAERMHALGLVTETNPRTWPSDEMAAESLGVPLQIVRIMGTHKYRSTFLTGVDVPNGEWRTNERRSTELVPVNAYRLGWQPRWSETMLLDSVDDEIRSVQETDKAKAVIS
ncbi:hypothetical protein QQX98_008539 [Neonectria punicea]|uniref:NAD-dependent epimerase/dehydratase domain-containing protein n=1 Tax=Neonectria punicea TaxID=979145 RepID=A0ABR1GVC2_9HYPO